MRQLVLGYRGAEEQGKAREAKGCKEFRRGPPHDRFGVSKMLALLVVEAP